MIKRSRQTFLKPILLRSKTQYLPANSEVSGKANQVYKKYHEQSYEGTWQLFHKVSLRTFLCEAESSINNRPWTVETLNDPLLGLPLSPSILLTGKTRLVLPPAGEFKREDLNCSKK